MSKKTLPEVMNARGQEGSLFNEIKQKQITYNSLTSCHPDHRPSRKSSLAPCVPSGEGNFYGNCTICMIAYFIMSLRGAKRRSNPIHESFIGKYNN